MQSGDGVIKNAGTDLLMMMTGLGYKKKRNPDELGQFVYKFKEGHSKNFKQDAKFDYFLSN